ncbi:hypothetical protein [Streptomyces sp. MST-110588]|uniref:hypothetical protein n=1 Tax=Streptomyces sp. MST-110588 TaxID=2833628 RepID=UPI001F5E25C3|nr:hypothetical protein [Streptomyces sp. MST-110588]UNO43166.1 hypothetical protein KGS77_31320 [Streptomyces sp. MST-110588]
MPVSSCGPPTRRTALRTAASALLTVAAAPATSAASAALPASATPAASATARAAPSVPVPPDPAAVSPAKRSLIIAADQATSRVLLLDPATRAARHKEGTSLLAALATLSPVWTWAPGADAALAPLRPDLTWRNVSEAKFRVLRGQDHVVMCASEGFAAVVAHPGGAVHWAAAVPRANLHSAELLPNGDVAVAGSTAGFVRVYAASAGPRRTEHAEYRLPGAHGLRWQDAAGGRLWALGRDRLVALSVGTAAGLPTLTEVFAVPLPDPGGHDLATVIRDKDRMWVTTGKHVHQFSAGRGAFVPYDQAPEVDRPQVKSVSDDPYTGRILTVSPQAGHVCTWCSSTISLAAPGGTETLPGSSLYKARFTAV